MSIHNHNTNRDKETSGLIVTIRAIDSCMDIPDYMAVEEISPAAIDNKHLRMLSKYVLCEWSPIRAEVQKDL